MSQTVPTSDRFEVSITTADDAFWKAVTGEQHWTFQMGGSAPMYRHVFSHAVLLRPLGMLASYRRIYVERPVKLALHERLGETPEQDGYRWEMGSLYEAGGAIFRTTAFLFANADDAMWTVARIVESLGLTSFAAIIRPEDQVWEERLREVQASTKDWP